MRVQRSRDDVLPLTWEIPAAIATSWLLLAVLALPAGQGLACALAGHGFVWPRGGLVESVIGLCQGLPGRELPGAQADPVPATRLIYAAIAVAETLLSVLAVFCLMFWWRTIGPGAQVGLATGSDVRRVLGPGNLRRRRPTIRPDLHDPTRLRRALENRP